MIVLDASVLIAHLDSEDAHHERARALLLRAPAEILAANPLTIAEVLVGPTRVGMLDRASAALAQLGINNLPQPDDTPQRLAVLRVRTGLKLPDCCVLLAAQQTGGSLATVDERLAGVANDIGVPTGD